MSGAKRPSAKRRWQVVPSANAGHRSDDRAYGRSESGVHDRQSTDPPLPPIASPPPMLVAMPEPQRTSAQIIIEEIRRQVDHQVSAADALDTKALAIFAGAAAVAAFIAPRVTVATPDQIGTSLGTFTFLIGALVCLLFAVRPRIGGFSNGPSADDIALRIDDPAGSLERELVPAFVSVRTRNEDFLSSKGGWIINAMRFLIATVIGIAAMVGVGAIR
jgi:hypothetical protein